MWLRSMHMFEWKHTLVTPFHPVRSLDALRRLRTTSIKRTKSPLLGEVSMSSHFEEMICFLKKIVWMRLRHRRKGSTRHMHLSSTELNNWFLKVNNILSTLIGRGSSRSEVKVIHITYFLIFKNRDAEGWTWGFLHAKQMLTQRQTDLASLLYP